MIISNLHIQYYNNRNPGYIIYIYRVPVVCPLFWWLNPPKNKGLFQSKNQGHLGSRYTIVMMCNVDMGVSLNGGTPQSSILKGFNHYKPSILGYLYFWKHPCVTCI